MKIRTNYVSNSSSSSFIIIYKNKSDFIKFDRFNGFEQFMTDLENCDIKSSKNLIAGFLSDYVYRTYNKFTNEEFEFVSNDDLITQDYLDFIFNNSQESEEKYRTILYEIGHKGYEFWERNRGYLNNLNPEYVTYLKECHTKLNSFNEILDDIAEKVVKNLEKDGYQLSWIRYCDDTDIGSYMEQRFMPFLCYNPEKEYLIISRNEH